MTYRVKDWQKFQHFKDRRPPWIKLYRDILDDPDWHTLDPQASKVLVMLWLIASEDESQTGTLPDIRRLAFRLRMSESKVISYLSMLSHWLIHDDDKMISRGYQNDAPETETETETYREETENNPLPPKNKKVTLDELSVDHIADWLREKRSQGKYLRHDEHFILEQFRNYCQSKGKRYADYVAGYRNAFEWERCQPKAGAAKVARGSHPGLPPKSKWDIEAERIAEKWIAEAQRNGEIIASEGVGDGQQTPKAVRPDGG